MCAWNLWLFLQSTTETRSTSLGDKLCIRELHVGFSLTSGVGHGCWHWACLFYRVLAGSTKFARNMVATNVLQRQGGLGNCLNCSLALGSWHKGILTPGHSNTICHFSTWQAVRKPACGKMRKFHMGNYFRHELVVHTGHGLWRGPPKGKIAKNTWRCLEGGATWSQAAGWPNILCSLPARLDWRLQESRWVRGLEEGFQHHAVLHGGR